jgi:sterol desaturase/sphingolipid hydroxylase (fatty acid hydroxylase superfamily)
LAFPLIFGAQMVYAYQVVGEGRHPAGFLFPVSYLTIAVLEWVFTFEPRWRNYWRDLLPDSIFMMLGNVVRGIADPLMASVGFFVAAILAGEAASGESSGIWPHESPLWLQWMLALMIAELGQYWAHRAGHEIEFFWRFHSVHHSSAQLYFLNAARFHPIDALWLSVCSTLPLLMLGASREVLILVGSFSLCHGVFQHSNLILKLGPLNQFFSMTELHRWHHSGVIEEANTNYGTNLILWDTILAFTILRTSLPDLLGP